MGRRRSWTAAEKATIVAESYLGAESVCAVARRHGLRHTQLFTWRREMRRAAQAAGLATPAATPMPLFVPAVIDPAPPPAPAAEAPRRSSPGRTRRRSPATVELEIGGAVVRIAQGADAATIAAVVAALKGSA